MLEQLKYKNHENEIFEFGKDGIFVNVSNLHDYSWEVKKKNNRITSLDYGVVTKKLPVVIFCATEAKGIEARNRLLEVVEKDVLALQHGRIIIGDYYFKCFVTKSEKKDYLKTKQFMTLNLTLTSDLPYWVKETSNVFMAGAGSIAGDGLDYNYDYPHDYYNDMKNASINNPGFVASNFRLVINGPCNNPVVYVGDHAYQVNCDVAAGEYLVIDSSRKTVELTATNGTKTNVFNSRNKASYIFEKIPAGKNPVTWEGNFNFEIVLLEERSEPKWT